VDFVAGGYLLCLPWEPPSGERTEGKLPSKVLTASDCLSVIGPGPWGFSWVNDDADERFGISVDRLGELATWLDAQMKAGGFGWPSLFLDLTTARAFLQLFRPTSHPHLIGLALPASGVAAVLADEPDREGVGTNGYVVGLRKGQPLAAGGTIRGYEILGEKCGAFHSWHCNCLASLVQSELGVGVNEYGLIDDYQSAVRATELVRSPATGAEPIRWDMWLIAEYPVDS
jgi:hypothetical protein